jgi:hypothetical protein
MAVQSDSRAPLSVRARVVRRHLGNRVPVHENRRASVAETASGYTLGQRRLRDSRLLDRLREEHQTTSPCSRRAATYAPTR